MLRTIHNSQNIFINTDNKNNMSEINIIHQNVKKVHVRNVLSKIILNITSTIEKNKNIGETSGIKGNGEWLCTDDRELNHLQIRSNRLIGQATSSKNINPHKREKCHWKSAAIADCSRNTYFDSEIDRLNEEEQI